VEKKRGNPKIKEYGKNTRFGTKRGCDPVEAAKKSNEAQNIGKILCFDLKERLTPERIAKMNERIISMAERGNINAWKEIRDSIGEKPSDKLEVSGTLDIGDAFAAIKKRREERKAKEETAGDGE